jgi:hypothetical protein
MLNKDLDHLQAVHSLIESRKASRPLLALRLHVCERQVDRIIEALNEFLGDAIAYSAKEHRFYYTRKVIVDVDISVDDKAVIRIK